MGFWKQWQMSRRFRYIGDKYVCANCFDDYAIREFINNNADEKACDYCGTTASVPIAAHIHEVITFILDGIEFEWGNPDGEGVAWEGGYVGETFDSDELIITGEVALETNNESLLDDIIHALSDSQWCQKHFYELRPEDALRMGWAEFTNQVKHRTRYFFHSVTDTLDEFRGYEEILPSQMLYRIARIVSELGIIHTIRADTKLWRARIHKPSESYTKAAELGPPLPDNAVYSNRMSPAGIPMFYGSLSEQTALKETILKPVEKTKVATIATFRTLGELRVLDLTKLPKIPSLFDQSNRELRPAIKFLRSFVVDISKPIEKDGREHIDYVPTQVFTEYFRHIYEDNEGNGVDGILYPSSKDIGNIACVLFLENEHCCDVHPSEVTRNRSDMPKYLLLEKVKRITLNPE